MINLDFADVRAVMDEMGKAMMGTGEAEGEDRAIQMQEKAIANPLLDEISLKGARGVLINITGGHDLTLFELDEAANRVEKEVDVDTNIIVGSTLDETMQGLMRVSVVATGIDASEVQNELPLPQRNVQASIDEDSGQFEEPEAREPAIAAETQDAFDGMPVQDSSIEENLRFDPEPEAYHAPDDDLPPPLYSEPVVEEPEAFVAAKPPLAGTPSEQGMERLRSAVQNSGYNTSNAALDEDQDQAEKPRFGIGSLINRMSGNDADKTRFGFRKQPSPPAFPHVQRRPLKRHSQQTQSKSALKYAVFAPASELKSELVIDLNYAKGHRSWWPKCM